MENAETRGGAAGRLRWAAAGLGLWMGLSVVNSLAGEPGPSLARQSPPSASTEKGGVVHLRVAGIQMPVTRDVSQNVAVILRAIDRAAEAKADVLVTPEGALSGYTEKFDRTATAAGIETVVARARERNVALVLGTCFAEPNGALYDAQRFYDRKGGFLGFHAKILLCRSMTEPGRKGEVDSFQTAPLRLFELDGLKVGGLVCNDLWANPEWTPMPDPFLSRQLADKGARVVFHSVNAGQDEGEPLALVRSFHDVNLRLRARASKLWVVVVDACDPTAKKSARCPSGVVGPDGRWVVQVDPKGEQFFVQMIEVERPR
ncbi:MAG: carbon-nitrogen hydrolase family protein [Isosphaeraceae bacterium]